jgi:hypothetical protein
VLSKAGNTTRTIRFQLCYQYLTDIRADLAPATPAPAVTTTAVPTTRDLTWGRGPSGPADEEPVAGPGAATLPEVTGSLAVTTTPPGAEVYVDGSLRGISPVTVTGLASGTHSVHLKLPGYADNTALVAITAGTTLPYGANLGPGTAGPSGEKPTQYAPGIGIVSVLSAAGAALFLSRRSR